jgi:exosortase family protein XrtF
VLIDTVAKVKVIEGCNGLSVMVLFVSFMLGFGRFTWDKAWFMGLGLLAIHAFNVMRVAVLALLIHHTDRTYYDLQKNMFTGSIYVLVLVLWVWWTHRATLTNNPANNPKE